MGNVKESKLMSKEEFTSRLMAEQKARKKKKNQEYRDYKAGINNGVAARNRYGKVKGSRYMEV